LGQFDEINQCEALIDALAFWQAGFHNVTASYGVSGFTPDHLAAFQLNGTRRVLIAYGLGVTIGLGVRSDIRTFCWRSRCQV
jgi:hypothetical protein